jgi:sulfide:quinone oxidoreductase
VYESAFALARLLESKGKRDGVRITVVSPDTLETELADATAAAALTETLETYNIELLTNRRIQSLTQNSAITNTGDAIDFNLLMLVPPFRGSSAAKYLGVTNDEGFIQVDASMRVIGHQRIYAAGDCVNFAGPKMGHMAIRQADVAAANLAAEIEGQARTARYSHEMRYVLDQGEDSVYVHKDLSQNGTATVRHGRFWSWAKEVQRKYWEATHS